MCACCPAKPAVVRLFGGFGVGTVTMAGLGLEVGGPRPSTRCPGATLKSNVRAAAGAAVGPYGAGHHLLGAPGRGDGHKKRSTRVWAFVGGISILGTTGIVKPYSTAAYRASVVQGVQVAATLGHGVVVLTTGGRTSSSP